MKTGTIAMIGGVVALLLSAALSAMYYSTPLWSNGEPTWGEAGIIGSIGLAGVLAGGAVIWSARHKGRWGWVGLLLGVAYLGLAFTPAFAASTIHTHGFLALFVIWFAGMNTLWDMIRRRRG